MNQKPGITCFYCTKEGIRFDGFLRTWLCVTHSEEKKRQRYEEAMDIVDDRGGRE